MHATFPTSSIVVKKSHVAAIASGLVQESCWFEVAPLPFDKYEVAVKEDRAPTLKQIAAEVIDA